MVCRTNHSQDLVCSDIRHGEVRCGVHTATGAAVPAAFATTDWEHERHPRAENGHSFRAQKMAHFLGPFTLTPTVGVKVHGPDFRVIF